MKPLLKHCLLFTLFVAFSTLALPAYAQKNGFLKAVEAALSKKRPAAAALAERKAFALRKPAVSGQQLNAAIQRATLKQIQEVELQIRRQNVFHTPQMANELFKYPFSIEDWNVKIDLKKLITPHTPDYLPVFGFEYPLEDDAFHQIHKSRRVPSVVLWDVLEYCTQLDELFFMEKDGQFFLNVPAVKYFRSYTAALDELKFRLPHIQKVLQLQAVRNFTARRNLQIATALNTYNDLHEPQFDPTTQRTAEEIQSLLNNLDPTNPLRQEIENALKNAAQNGHIAPAEDSTH